MSRRNRNTARIERYIRDAAVKRGIDPDVAVKVARSEGLGGNWQSNVVKNGRREKSYGPFQLYTGGGLGNLFQKETGLDPADPETVFEGIDFALDHAARHGWGSWYGAAKVGVGRWAGLKGAQPLGVTPAQEMPAETIAEDPRSRGLLANLGAPQDAGLFSYAPQEQEQPSMFGSLFGITPAAAAEMPGPERFGYDPDLSAAQAEYARAVQAPPDYHAIQKATQPQAVDQPAGLLAEPNPARFGSLRVGGLEPIGATETLAPTAATETVVGQDVTPTTTPKTSRLPSSLPGVARFGQPEQTPAPERFGPLGYAPVEHPTPNLAGIFGPEQGWALNALDENDLSYRDPTIASPEEEIDPDLPMAGTETIADDYPAAPEKPKDKGLFSPETKAGMAMGSLLGPAGMVGGGLIGRALAGSGGLLGGNPMAGPVSPSDRYGVGSGMMGIQSAMYGPRGATGYSRSNPGSFVTSRGPQFGYDLTNQFGATTHYTPSGNIAATRDSNARFGGLLNGLFGGGLLGGGNRGGMSDRERAEWSGRSGLF